jgi:hypothetical protein
MPMEETTMSPTQSTGVAPALEQGAAVPSQVKTQHPAAQPQLAPSVASPVSPKRVGYGMPCARCTTYYAANLAACPVCQSSERVAPVAAVKTNTTAVSEAIPAPAVLEEERGPTATPVCTHEENHRGTTEAATVCQACYDQLQERVDVLEAVLHMDVKEAAEVIYDAVWSDPSDPSKTYQNAAQAILSELKKRSGITPVFGPLQPLAH